MLKIGSKDDLNEAKTKLYISETKKKWITKIARVLSNGYEV